MRGFRRLLGLYRSSLQQLVDIIYFNLLYIVVSLTVLKRVYYGDIYTPYTEC